MNGTIKTPEVSVIIAARDYGHFLDATLRSVQQQTYKNWECVLVDDGSRDRTPEVVQPFLKDVRFKYVRTDTLGQPRAKNLGLRLSSAPLVAYLDGDDLWLPSKLDRQVRLLNVERNVGVVFTRRLLIDPEGGLLPSVHAPFPRGAIFDRMLLDNFVCFSSMMIRREVLEHVGAFDERLELAIDYDLWLRVAPHVSFDFIDEPLVKYRTGHGNLSRRIVDRLKTIFSIMRRCLTRRGNDATVSRSVQREAWGSTCRTMAYVLRDREPNVALGWYFRAATHDRRWGSTLRAFLKRLLQRGG